MYTNHQEGQPSEPPPRLLCDTLVTLFILLIADACIIIQSKSLKCAVYISIKGIY
jgi:hypothetical protein